MSGLEFAQEGSDLLELLVLALSVQSESPVAGLQQLVESLAPELVVRFELVVETLLQLTQVFLLLPLDQLLAHFVVADLFMVEHCGEQQDLRVALIAEFGQFKSLFQVGDDEVALGDVLLADFFLLLSSTKVSQQ